MPRVLGALPFNRTARRGAADPRTMLWRVDRMPIHDWSRVDPGLFHDFHQAWVNELRNALNGGGLPPGFFALAEQLG